MGYLEFQNGELIKDSFKVFDIKEGGLGRVYFAFCSRRQMKVVIKTICRKIWEEYNLSSCWSLVKSIDSEQIIDRPLSIGEYIYLIFIREAKILCQAQGHPNVLRGIDYWFTE